MEETIQGALKVQSSLLPQGRAAEWLCIMWCKTTVHVILSWTKSRVVKQGFKLKESVKFGTGLYTVLLPYVICALHLHCNEEII